MASQYETDENGMYQANWPTGGGPGLRSPKFRKWHRDPVSGWAHPENEMVRYNGQWLLPKDYEDAVADEAKRRN